MLTCLSAGIPIAVQRQAALPSTNNEAFLSWLTQPGTGPAASLLPAQAPVQTLNTKPP